MSSRRSIFRGPTAYLGRAIDCLPRWVFSRWGLLATDASISVFAIWLAWQLRFDFVVPSRYVGTVSVCAVALLLIRPACLWIMGAHRSIWRYFNLGDAVTLCVAAIPPTVVMLMFRIGWLHAHPIAVLPFTVIVLDYGIFVLCGVGIRGLRRYLFEASLETASPKRTLLMGTAEGLASALRQISFDPEIQVICLLSPDKQLHGASLAGVTVRDGPGSLAGQLASNEIDLVLIADDDVAAIGDAVSTAMDFGVEVRLLPLASQIIRGNLRIAGNPKPELAIKESVKVSDLVHPTVVEAFRGRSILITGAGGSIGSELSRQVARLAERLLLLDQDENSVFQIHGDLSAHSRVQLVPLIADIRDRDSLSYIFTKYKPNIVLHAAAYKHVPLMEHNCSEAVLNNIVGTRLVAEASINFGAERFLMISSDKAVNPISIMGATKRMAELTVQHLATRRQQNGNCTRCTCVRFGNVIGSNGSVVPIFLRQIAAGGPVTITHEEMTRYFMTIPAAVQLVLQATTLGADGEVYMLEMGDPLKIAGLARRLIEMSGLRPGQDIEIRVVGIRPGEKLSEQLWSDSATVNPTTFANVLQVEPSPPPPDFEDKLALIEAVALKRDDDRTRQMMAELPINYGEPLRATA